MLVISDTSPLNYLILVRAIDVLPSLFDDIYVPPIVLQELAHPASPDEVRNWGRRPPSWLQVQAPAQFKPIAGLHRGETEAIALAEEMSADALLIDERDATRIARQRGIPVVGTIAVLAKAIALGLIDLEETTDALRKTNFRGPIESIGPLVQRFKTN